MIIRNQKPAASIELDGSTAASVARKSRRKLSYKQFVLSGSFALYSGAFLLIVSMIAVGYQPPERITAAASAVEIGSTTTTTNTATRTVSVDDVIAASVAANIAETANLPIATNVANLSQSLTAESTLAENESNIVTKPQIVEAGADSRAVTEYVTKAGDTVPDVARRHGLTPETVKWANNLNSDALEAGRTIKLLPVNGVLHTVSDSDTVDSLVQRYGANRTQLVIFNDLEINGLTAGSQIIIPEGELPETERPGYVAPVTRPAAGLNYGNYSGGSGTANHYAASVGNRYAFGNCTWYAYERRVQLGRPVGSFWGNANTWAIYAQSAGYTVTGTPTVGSIMQNGGGYGHVSIVESVNPGVSITISEMNGYRFGGGFNRIGTGEISWSEATSGFYRYIQ